MNNWFAWYLPSKGYWCGDGEWSECVEDAKLFPSYRSAATEDLAEGVIRGVSI